MVSTIMRLCAYLLSKLEVGKKKYRHGRKLKSFLFHAILTLGTMTKMTVECTIGLIHTQLYFTP